jgi:hypothetical protein
MFRPLSGGNFGRSRSATEMERTRVLIDNLCAHLRPLVEAVVKPKIAAMLAEPTGLSEDEAANVKSGIKDAVAGCFIPEITPETFAALDDSLRNPPPLSPEELETEMTEGIDIATHQLVTAWVSSLHAVIAAARYGGTELSGKFICDDMLPTDPEIMAAFEESCGQVDLTPVEARGILCAFHATWGDPTRLPADLIEILLRIG